MGLDIDLKLKIFADAIDGAGTVVWNGPMGVVKWHPSAGTIAVQKRLRTAVCLDYRRR